MSRGQKEKRVYEGLPVKTMISAKNKLSSKLLSISGNIQTFVSLLLSVALSYYVVKM